MSTSEIEQQTNRVKDAAMFLYQRGLTSRAMDDWNLRIAQLGALGDGLLADRAYRRLVGKLEKATMKQLRETGLMDEWRASWTAKQDETQ